jgi:hypothetical protein
MNGGICGRGAGDRAKDALDEHAQKQGADQFGESNWQWFELSLATEPEVDRQNPNAFLPGY